MSAGWQEKAEIRFEDAGEHNFVDSGAVDTKKKERKSALQSNEIYLIHTSRLTYMKKQLAFTQEMQT